MEFKLADKAHISNVADVLESKLKDVKSLKKFSFNGVVIVRRDFAFRDVAVGAVVGAVLGGGVGYCVFLGSAAAGVKVAVATKTVMILGSAVPVVGVFICAGAVIGTLSRLAGAVVESVPVVKRQPS